MRLVLQVQSTCIEHQNSKGIGEALSTRRGAASTRKIRYSAHREKDQVSFHFRATRKA